jgi:tetratricopeptide (TPR) repeat protein
MQVTSGKALPKEIADQIIDRTDGVPLFLEELTKTVLESGLLQERGDRFVLERPLPRFAIPTSLHGSLMARLDRLAPVREVAQSGSIIGREFSYELLSEITDLPKEKLDDGLAELCRAELVFCRGTAPVATYVFKHALVRDAAYAGLLKSRRVQLHAAVATAFEQRFTDMIETEPETIAHHLTEADLFEKAVSYWLRAGKNAAMRFANIEAIAHLRRGIEVVERLSDGPERDRIDLDLQLVLGPCLIATQPTSSAAVATFARARKLCERLGDPPEYLLVMHWLMVALAVRGELLQAREASETLLNLAEARGDRSASLNALRAVGLMNLLTGRIVIAHSMTERMAREFASSNEAERAAARAAGQDAGAAGLAVMSWALWLLGYIDDAVNRMTAALRRAEEVQHPHTLAYAFYYASVSHALRGEHLTAQRYAKRCFQTSEEHGFRQWQGPSGTVRAICTNMLDPSSDPIDQVLRRWHEYRGAGYQFGMTAVSVLLCKVLLTRSQFDTVVDVVEHGLSVCNVNSERFFEAELYRLKAIATRLVGKGGSNIEVPPLLDKALQVARNQGARSLEIRCARDLADIWREQGKYSEARGLLAPIYGWFTEGFDTPVLQDAKALLDELA